MDKKLIQVLFLQMLKKHGKKQLQIEKNIEKMNKKLLKKKKKHGKRVINIEILRKNGKKLLLTKEREKLYLIN